jgi:hypothetical protein
MFADKDIPAKVKTALKEAEKSYKYDDLSIGLLAIANSVASDYAEMDKMDVFKESLEILMSQLEANAELQAFPGVLFIGADPVKDWNADYIKEVSGEWASLDVAKRDKLKADGVVLMDGGKVVSKLTKYEFDSKAKTLTFRPDAVTYWESEADPVVFVDKRPTGANGKDNFGYNQPLYPRYSTTLWAIVNKQVGNVVTPKLARIKVGYGAANPTNKNSRLKEFAKLSFKYYTNFMMTVTDEDDTYIYGTLKGMKYANPDSKISFADMRSAILKFPNIEAVKGNELLDWVAKYATKGVDVDDKYGHYFYAEMQFTHFQKFEKSGDISLHFQDSTINKDYTIQGQMPAGVSMEDFGILPGSKVQIVGRAFKKKSVYNNKTQITEQTPWPGFSITGIHSFLNMKKYQVDALLAGTGVNSSLTNDGDDQ